MNRRVHRSGNRFGQVDASLAAKTNKTLLTEACTRLSAFRQLHRRMILAERARAPIAQAWLDVQTYF